MYYLRDPAHAADPPCSSSVAGSVTVTPPSSYFTVSTRGSDSRTRLGVSLARAPIHPVSPSLFAVLFAFPRYQLVFAFRPPPCVSVLCSSPCHTSAYCLRLFHACHDCPSLTSFGHHAILFPTLSSTNTSHYIHTLVCLPLFCLFAPLWRLQQPPITHPACSRMTAVHIQSPGSTRRMDL